MAQPGYITIPGEDELPNALVDDYYRAAAANYWPQPKYNWWEPMAAGALTGIGQGVGSYFTQQQQIEDEQRKYQMELQKMQEQARLQEQAAQAAYDRQQMTAAEERNRQGAALGSLGRTQQGGVYPGSKGLFEAFDEQDDATKAELWKSWPDATKNQYLERAAKGPAAWALDQNMPNIKAWADLTKQGREAERQARLDEITAQQNARAERKALLDEREALAKALAAEYANTPAARALQQRITEADIRLKHMQANEKEAKIDEEKNKGLIDRQEPRVRALIGLYGGVITGELVRAVPIYSPADIRAIANGDETFLSLFVSEATYRSTGGVSTRTDRLGETDATLGTSETRRSKPGTYSTMPHMVAFLKSRAGPQAAPSETRAVPRGDQMPATAQTDAAVKQTLQQWAPFVTVWRMSKAETGPIVQFAENVLKVMTTPNIPTPERLAALRQLGVDQPPSAQIQEALRFLVANYSR